jgi:hypothetical protein
MKPVAALSGFAFLVLASTTFADTQKKCRVDVHVEDNKQFISGLVRLNVEIKRKNAKDVTPRSPNVKDYEIPANKFEFRDATPKGQFTVAVRFKHGELYEGASPENTDRVWLELAVIQAPAKAGEKNLESTAISYVNTMSSFSTEVRHTVGTKSTWVQLDCVDPEE